MPAKPAKAAKNAKKAESAAKAAELDGRVRAAYTALPETLARLAPFAVAKKLSARLDFAAADDLTPDQLAWVMSTLRSNMGPVYGPEAWPGQERARKRDAQHADTRFVFARNEPPAGEGEPATPPPPLAFAQYRFVVEEGVPLLYLYELQVVDGERGRGLGRFLLLFVEMLAKACPGALGGVMLTLQKANERAAAFYARAKYALDETSPCRADPFAEESEYDFEVYSKLFSDEAREALKRAGAEERSKSCAEREREAGRGMVAAERATCY